MFIIKVSGKDTLEKALKKLKRKFDNTKTLKELRNRKEYKKPSIKKREKLLKAKYVQSKFKDNN
jgi:small subunit ribosomal protein S21